MGRTVRLVTGEVWMIVKSPVELRETRLGVKPRGLTQTDLANLAGVTQQYISRLETGIDRDCSDAVARRICRYLGRPLGDLFEARSSTVMPTSTSHCAAGSTRRLSA